MSRPGAQHARKMLARSHGLAAQIEAPDFPLEPFEKLQKWQQQRLATTYDDLMQQDSYRPACIFFLDELYGGLDFRERDQDVAKVMPVMATFLPDKTLMTMGEAFELQAISLEFDIKVSDYLQSRGVSHIGLDDYRAAYRGAGGRPEREKQILLIRQLALDLAQLVDKPLVARLVRLMRGPAHAAGFGELQTFLESGLSAFQCLEDTEFFADTIFEREWRAMQNLFAGKPDPYRL